MDKIEKIHRILKGKETIFISKTTVDNTKRTVTILDPKDKKVEISQILVNNNLGVTGNLTIALAITGKNGVAVLLDDYDTVIATTKGASILGGGKLIINRPCTISATDAVNEDEAYSVEVEWKELDTITDNLDTN
jgi:hypothetical protein